MADNTSRLLLTIDASVEVLRRELSAGEAQIAGFERDATRRLNVIDGSFKRLGGGMDPVIAKFSALKAGAAAVGVGFAINGLQSLVRSSLELATSLSEAAQKTGTTVEQYQILSRAALAAGVDQGMLDGALIRLNKTLGEAKAGSAKAAAVFTRMGIDIRGVGSAGEVMPQVITYISGLKDSATQAAAASTAMGKSAGNMLPFLTAGADGYAKMAEEAKAAGLITNEMAEAADAANDDLDKLALTLKTNMAVGLLSVLPLMQEAATSMGAIGAAARDAIKWVDDLLKVSGGPGLGESVVNAVKGVNPAAGLALEYVMFRAERTRAVGRATARASATSKPPVAASEDEASEFSLAKPDKPRSAIAEKKRTDKQVYDAFARELKREGIAPTSGFRTFEEQARLYRTLPKGGAARPGTSEHEFHRAFDFGPNVDREALARAAARAKVKLAPELVHGKKRHLHQEFADAGERGGGGEAELARQAEDAARAAKEKQRRDYQFASEERRGQIDLLRAQQDLTTDYVERTALALRILDAERAQEQAAITQDVRDGEITLAQADIKLATLAKLDALERQKVNAEEQAERADQYARFGTELAELEKAKLEREVASATTENARRAAELRLLDLVLEQERVALQAVIDSDASENDKAIAGRKRDDLPEKREAQTGDIVANTRGPIEDMLSRIPKSAGKVNEALEAIAASGLNSLTDGITDAIVKGESLGKVFKRIANQIIADLVRIAVQRAIIEPLANALFPGSSGGSGGGATGSGGGGAILNFLGGMLKGGRASGGPVSRNDLYMVGERGPELFVPSVSGKIIANDNLRRGGGTRASSGAISLTVNAPGATAETVAMIRRELANAAPMIVEASMTATMRAQSRPRL